MGTTEIIISLIGGFFAGILNTLAGFGSIITLAIYIDVLNLPGHIANATNRVNVLASSSISAATFHSNGKIEMEKGKWIILWVFIGAMIGVYLATQLDAEGFKEAFKYLLVLILIFLLVNPKKFINPDPAGAVSSPWLTIPIYIAMGVYAGFLQAGFGVLFLMVMVIMSRFDIIEASGLKMAVVAIYTLAIVAIFHFNGMIVWQSGLMLAVGQAIGGYVTAKNMTRFQGANVWAYRLIVLIVVAVIIKNFELWKYFM